MGAGRDHQSSWLYTHIEAYQSLADRVEVVGFVDRVLRRAEWAAHKWDVKFAGDHVVGALRELEPDVVSICTPPSDRLEIVTACDEAECVRGIWCEKPYGLVAPPRALCQVNLIRRFDRRHVEIHERRQSSPQPADLVVLAARDIHTVVHFTDLARWWGIEKHRLHYHHFHGPSLYVLRESGEAPGRYSGWHDEAFIGGGVETGFMERALSNLLDAMAGQVELVCSAQEAIKADQWAAEILDRRSVSGPRRRPLEDRFWPNVRKTDTCWLWTGSKRSDGYGYIAAGGVRGKNLKAHRVSYELKCGPIPRGMAVCHHCDVPLCVRPEHLFLGTIQENNHDRHRKGRSRGASPQNHNRTKLTISQVREIRSSTLSGPALAKRYGTTKENIWQIRRGNTWRSV